jgi:glycosyltransferase involved in cell wall biosynthesis
MNVSAISSRSSPPLSILLLARSLLVGGAERQLVELAKGLHGRGHRVQVALFYTGGPLDRELIESGVAIIDLRKKGRWDVPSFLLALARTVRERRPDIVYSFLGTANMAAALVKPISAGARLIWSVRASDMDLASYGALFRLAYAAECRLAGVADLIISNSQAGARYAVAHGFPEKRIRVVPNGVDTGRFFPDPASRGRMREEWQLANGTIAVGVLARLDPMKDHPNFLTAAGKLAARDPRLRFLCIGEGPENYTRELRRMAADLGLADRIRFPGRTDAAPALNALDICCSSSAFGEGFSNSVAEAMACGVPCVVTDVGDSAEVVGETGIVVPPRDPESLARAIEELTARSVAAGQAARKRIEQNFTIDAMIDRTLALIGP